MQIKDNYCQFLTLRVNPAAGTISSYVRAMDIIDEALKANEPSQESVWYIRDVSHLQQLLEYVKREQRKVDGGIFKAVKTKSYWRQGFCSAALVQFIEFVETQS